MTKSKNTWGKTRPQDKPYAIVFHGDWEWRILKAYQTYAKEQANPYARYFCAVKSPYTNGRYDLGDVYVKEIPWTPMLRIALQNRVHEEESAEESASS